MLSPWLIMFVQFHFLGKHLRQKIKQNKTSPKQYLHILEHSKSFLEKAQEIPAELWYTFSHSPAQFPGEKRNKNKMQVHDLVIF